MAGDFLGAAENGAQTLRTVFLALDRRFVAQAELAADLRRSGIGAEENDLDVRMQALPALNSVALDHANMPGKGFRCRKEGQHTFLLTLRLGAKQSSPAHRSNDRHL